MPHIQQMLPGFDPFEKPSIPQERHVVPIAPDFQEDLDAQHRWVVEVRHDEDPRFEQTGVNDRIARDYAEDHPRRNPVAAEAARAERRAIRQRLKPRRDSALTLDYRNPPYDEGNLPTDEDAMRSRIGNSMVGAVLRDDKNK